MAILLIRVARAGICYQCSDLVNADDCVTMEGCIWVDKTCKLSRLATIKYNTIYNGQPCLSNTNEPDCSGYDGMDATTKCLWDGTQCKGVSMTNPC